MMYVIYADCRIKIFMLSVTMLNVVILSVLAPNKTFVTVKYDTLIVNDAVS